MRATNLIVYLWNLVIAAMAQIINTTILFTEPVPECVEYKKRMVLGSILQLAFILAILYIKYHRKVELSQLKFFLTIDIVLMEGIFMYRWGISFYHFMVGPVGNQDACQISDKHIKAFLAPYYLLIIMRFVIYFILAKYMDQIYKNLSKNELPKQNSERADAESLT